ncbi:TetR/AcrR family transcriptional regulator [Nocardia noduli]|uniref:TetR/AcrR family transcriptional regulator n=1 Tax=Nocardia noduli TaxID=2815722 RepID=UPI001C21F86A|nr:TetR/AcrR family transcriptional regulator [Nocardia noduli]
MKVSRVNRGPAAAAENRAAILISARTAFSQHGASVALSLIYETAGVSPGVFYRHFPDRESLTQAVFDEDIRNLEKIASRPDCTLDELLTAYLDQLVECTAFVSTLRPDHRTPAHAAAELRAHTLLADKLATDTSHTFRPGTAARDLLLAIGLIAALLTKTAEPMRRAAADEAWQLLLHGLRDTGNA